MKKIPMTALGSKLLQEELQRLKTVDRPKVINAIAEARALGDLKENAEYHAAREQQSFIEGRIIEIEGKLSNAQVIDVTQMENSGKVIFGATVGLKNTHKKTLFNYQIVGDDEADIKKAKISVSSPIARALIGKYEGDIVSVNTPEGVTEYEIIEVNYV